MAHIPVLQKEVIEYLNPKPNENFIDCTFGSGGHAKSILEKTGPKGRLLGIDADETQVKNSSALKNFPNRLVLVNDNYANLKNILERCKFKNISGILIDLGFSSWHIDESKRGFTFLKSEPLDMRYDLKNPLTAEKIVNYWSAPDIERIIGEFGQEPFAGQITRGIVEARGVINIKNTLQLAEIIKKSIPARHQRGRIHFATKAFQALRMAVNSELDNLKKVLPQTLEILNQGGRLCVISFHSLEDKIVKDFFNARGGSGHISIITKKPVQPKRSEILKNSRSRAAKMRAAVKI